MRKLIGKSAHLCLVFLLLLGSNWAQSNQYLQLSREVIEARLSQFKGKDSVREGALKKLFGEAGCNAEHLKEQRVSHSGTANVICILPGGSDDEILVGAHYDHVPAGDEVVDNWSGASLLPSLYQSLSSASRQHTFVFVGFTGEEEGMVGSRFYVKQLTKDEATRIHAMINMDTLGLGPTEIWVSNSDSYLVRLMAGVGSMMKLPVSGMNVDGVGDSDGSSFKRISIPIITVHSVTRETLGILHTHKDALSAIKLNEYYDSYNLIAGYLAVLDSKLDAKP